MSVKVFEFNPSGEDLINFYLHPWVKQPVPWNGIPVKEIYGPSSDPWVVFNDVESCWHSRLEEKGAIKYSIYAFTLLSRVSNSRRVSRGAGTGTWHGQTGPEMIQDSKNGQIIGRSKMLAFKRPGSDADFGRWTMHEYSLSDGLIRSGGVPNAADLVVCKITKIVKKNKKKSGAQPPLAGISKLPEWRTTEMFLPKSQGNGVWVRDPFDVSVPDPNQQDGNTSGAGEGSEVEPNDDEDLFLFEAELLENMLDDK